MPSRDPIRRGALVDFDGTLVRGDTMAALLGALARRSPARAALGLAWALLMALPWRLHRGRRSILSVGLWLLTVGLGRRRIARALREHGQRVALATAHAPFPRVVERLRALDRRGVQPWIVSGSCADWIVPVLRRHGIPFARVIGSQYEIRAGGLVLTRRCVGPTKVAAIEAEPDGRSMQWISAFGNDPSDRPMLALAREAWMVTPDGALVADARPAAMVDDAAPRVRSGLASEGPAVGGLL